MKRTLFTKQPLEEPDPPALCKNALYPPHRTEPCTDHHVHYSGAMPCTGVLICSMCGTTWHPETGKVLGVPSRRSEQ